MDYSGNVGEQMYVYTKDDTVTPLADTPKVLTITHETSGGNYHFIKFQIDLWEVE